MVGQKQHQAVCARDHDLSQIINKAYLVGQSKEEQPRSTLRIRDIGWLFTVSFGVTLSLLDFFIYVQPITSMRMMFSDFTAFWASAQVPIALVYDGAAMTEFQRPWLLPDARYKPFPYPPTVLMLTRLVLHGVDYGPAITLWTAGGLAAFLIAARKALGTGAAALTLCSFPVLFALTTGQMALFLSAVLLTALRLLPARPLLAGCMFGVLAAIKPQMVILAPLALGAVGQWRSIAAAGVTVIGATLLSLVLLGLAPWIDWIKSLDQFAVMVRGPNFWSISVSPYTLVREIGWSADVAMGALIVSSGVAVAAVVLTFRRTAATDRRLLALSSGSALCLPYVLHYDLTAAAPAYAALLLRRSGSRSGWIVGALGMTWLAGPIGPIFAVAWLLWKALASNRDPSELSIGEEPDADKRSTSQAGKS